MHDHLDHGDGGDADGLEVFVIGRPWSRAYNCFVSFVVVGVKGIALDIHNSGVRWQLYGEDEKVSYRLSLLRPHRTHPCCQTVALADLVKVVWVNTKALSLISRGLSFLRLV